MKDLLLNNPKLLKYFTFYRVDHNSFVGFFVERIREANQLEKPSNGIFFFKFNARRKAFVLNREENKRIAEAAEAFEIDI